MISKNKLEHLKKSLRSRFQYLRLFQVYKVPVYLHWPLSIAIAIAITLSLFNISYLIAAISISFVMLIHELGHMWFASRYKLETLRIELHLFHGTCFHEESSYEYHNQMVAWGGVAAQALIFIPCIPLHLFFDEFLPWQINMPLFFLGFYSAVIAAISLLPMEGLDGYQCWKTLHFRPNWKRKKLTGKKPNHLKVMK